ncbi:hypothetical protein [Sphingosinicella sp. BN140058]|uniref:hypothetical protein n=1 Tax=Sphingosinicella sp. BN140058 TaxID=1892855 RepID=UPI00101368B9|nr:hypothetical protein [Sphingosinicella sp. BN140058]QAY76364.1 hypothetical protein ETR14_07570 [Sphingosinicella sp. BN140058]
MRKLCLILLSLSACHNDAAEEGVVDAASEPQQALVTNAAVGSSAPDPAQLQAMVKQAMATVLPDAKAARYRNLHAGTGGAACGEVAAGSTAFRPFVVTPNAIAVVAATPAIAFEDPSDIFADAWIRWCATPDDLRRLGPVLQQAAASNVIETIPNPEIPPPGEPALPPPTPADTQPPPAAVAQPAPRPEIDSFFNSVKRQGE